MMLDGVKLMVMGMGYVFVFLVLMVVFMNIMAKILKPFSSFMEAPAAAPKAKSSADSADLNLIAAAVAAVEASRKG